MSGDNVDDECVICHPQTGHPVIPYPTMILATNKKFFLNPKIPYSS